MVFKPDVQRDGHERFIAGIYASFGYKYGICIQNLKYGDGDPAVCSISISAARGDWIADGCEIHSARVSLFSRRRLWRMME